MTKTSLVHIYQTVKLDFFTINEELILTILNLYSVRMAIRTVLYTKNSIEVIKIN